MSWPIAKFFYDSNELTGLGIGTWAARRFTLQVIEMCLALIVDSLHSVLDLRQWPTMHSAFQQPPLDVGLLDGIEELPDDDVHDEVVEDYHVGDHDETHVPIDLSEENAVLVEASQLHRLDRLVINGAVLVDGLHQERVYEEDG